MATSERVLAVAAGELGVREDPPGSNQVKYNTWYYGRAVSGGGYPWCMVFVQWVFHQAGVPLPKLTASCGELMRAAKAAGCWAAEDYRPGDVVIYDFPGGAGTDHCGIVERAAGGQVVAIEGNTGAESDADGGQVQRRTRPLRQVVGAVRPLFDEREDDDMDVGRFQELWLEMRKGYQDNESSQYSQEARQWAVENGLVTGSGKTVDGEPNYMWEDLMTREQFITVLYRFAKLAAAPGQTPAEGGGPRPGLV